jgi:hypothetical protein
VPAVPPEPELPPDPFELESPQPTALTVKPMLINNHANLRIFFPLE